MSDIGQDGDQTSEYKESRLLPSAKIDVPTPVVGSYGPTAYGAAQEEGNALVQGTLQYLFVALKRKWLILSIVFTIVALGTLKALMTTPRCTSTVRIQIDREPLKVLEHGLTDPAEEGGSDFLKTHFELLKSRAMAARVVSSLHLDLDEDFLRSGRAGLLGTILGSLSNRGTETPSSAELEDKAINLVAGGMDVRPLPGSRLV